MEKENIELGDKVYLRTRLSLPMTVGSIYETDDNEEIAVCYYGEGGHIFSIEIPIVALTKDD